MEQKIKNYMSELGKKSWEVRQKKYTKSKLKKLMSSAAKAKKGMKYAVKSSQKVIPSS